MKRCFWRAFKWDLLLFLRLFLGVFEPDFEDFEPEALRWFFVVFEEDLLFGISIVGFTAFCRC